MTHKDKRLGAQQPDFAAAERVRAEEIARTRPAPDAKDLDSTPTMALQRALYELHVHQIELEMQNEELRRTQGQLDAERARYVDLYDLAPVGYCTVDVDGMIRQANFAAADLLDLPRSDLQQRRISSFILRDDQDIYYLMRQQLLQSGAPQSRELRMLKRDATVVWVQLTASVTQDATGTQLIRVALADIDERKAAQEELRIASVAFRGQGGIAVLDAQRTVLRVNPAFSSITGYTESEARGMTPAPLRTQQHPASFYEQMFEEVARSGEWRGDMWLRRKNGTEFPAQLTASAIKDGSGVVSQYVVHFFDATTSRLQEKSRKLAEEAHRHLLVREVHHRIKNNLQAIIGILRKFANRHPEIAPPLQQAIGQVQTISVVHGLQGRAVTSAVRLADLTQAIAYEIEQLWHTPITLALPAELPQQVLSEEESVPVALVLHELISNAVKHRVNGSVNVAMELGITADSVQICIGNTGHFATDRRQTGIVHSGLHLIAALMPRVGARIVREQRDDQVITRLELEPPVIFRDTQE